MTEIYFEHFTKYQVKTTLLKKKNLLDFLACNKVIILICCPFCMVSKEVRRYPFWEGGEPSCFSHCYILSGWQSARHTVDARHVCWVNFRRDKRNVEIRLDIWLCSQHLDMFFFCLFLYIFSLILNLTFNILDMHQALY